MENTNNLYVLNEVFTSYNVSLNYGILNVISIISIILSILVILTKNPVISVLFLIGLFLNIASYLMILGMNFIGLSYLLVYVGAVSILFLFILMLINVRVSELSTDNNNSIPLAFAIGIFFNFSIYNILPLHKSNNLSLLLGNYPSLTTTSSSIKNFDLDLNVSFVSSNIWDGALAEASHITSIGNIMYTSYPLWLILTSFILLLAMIGAIVITIKQ